MGRHYGWNVEEPWLVKTPGIVFALAQAVRAFTEPGDAVLLQQPVYYPFSQVIRDNGRKIVDNTLVQGEDGRYRIDFADFEEKIRSCKVKLFFLCNPHNPVGRVWTREELLRLGDICEKYGVIVVSDEIHADFVFEGSHQVLAGLKESYRKFVVTCTAPSKTSVSYTHLIAVSGGADFDELLEKVEELPTLYSVDLLNMDTCRNDLLMEDIKQYGREI